MMSTEWPVYLSHGVLEVEVLREADLLVKEHRAADGAQLVALIDQAADHAGRALGVWTGVGRCDEV